MAMKRAAVRALREVSRVSVHHILASTLRITSTLSARQVAPHRTHQPACRPHRRRHRMRLQACRTASPPAPLFPPSRAATSIGLRPRPRPACRRAGSPPLRLRLTTVRDHPPAATATRRRQRSSQLTLEDLCPRLIIPAPPRRRHHSRSHHRRRRRRHCCCPWIRQACSIGRRCRT